MKCTKCGAQLGGNPKFCEQCKTPVIRDVFCHSCGTRLQLGQGFCTTCGMKFDDSLLEPCGGMNSEVTSPNPEIKGTGKLLRKMSGITYFVGEPAVGVANKVGTLTVYDNRIEFMRKAGLSLVGTLSARAKAEVETYYYSDVISITTGTYLAMYTTLVLKLKNSNKVSFCPAIPLSKDMETVANLLIHYLAE